MKTPLITHPYLLSAFPILFLFAHNRGWFNGYREVAVLTALAVGVAALIHITLTFILKTEQKSALITSLIAALFFSYGHLYEAAYEHAWNFFPVNRHPYLLISFGVLFLVGTFTILRTKISLAPVTSALNIIGVTLIMLTTFNLATFNSAPKSHTSLPNTSAPDAIPPTDSPDVYYIILDAYQGASELYDFFGFDNSAFIEGLEKRGFFVADKSLSNYDGTTLSLPSSLNMDYLHTIWKESTHRIAIDELTPATRNNAVLRFLDNRGYTTIHIGHWHIPTFRNEYADISHEVGRFGDAFSQLVVRTTALSPFMQSFFATNIHHEVREAFSMLEATTKIRSPKFVFAHIISPHADYVFGPNGEETSEPLNLSSEEHEEWSKSAYIDQLQFVNSRITKAIDVILSESDTPPIIVIQSDHGTGFTKKTNYRNLTAILVPNSEAAVLYDTITPVNIFRTIFNTYFNGDFEQLPDKAYAVQGGDNAGYDVSHSTDITDMVKFD